MASVLATMRQEHKDSFLAEQDLLFLNEVLAIELSEGESQEAPLDLAKRLALPSQELLTYIDDIQLGGHRPAMPATTDPIKLFWHLNALMTDKALSIADCEPLLGHELFSIRLSAAEAILASPGRPRQSH